MRNYNDYTPRQSIPAPGRGIVMGNMDLSERRHQEVMQALNALVAAIAKPLRRVSPNRVMPGVPR